MERTQKHLTDLKENFNLFPDEKIPTVQQVYNLIRKRKNEEAPPILSIGELIEYCQKNSDVPSDEDKPFVFAYETCDENEDMYFRFAVSTTRMLSNCVGLEQICVDATYKLMWQGFPFLVVGTVDRAKKFHPLCFACCSNETEADFTFLFEAMKFTIEELFNAQFNPKILIADGSHAIRNAFKAVFNSEVMVMCYAHVLRNVTKRPLNNKKNRNPILKDLGRMNLARSPKEFKKMSKRFLKKWKKHEPEFMEYFEAQWLQTHCNWYESAAIYTPSTNNNLEGMFS